MYQAMSIRFQSFCFEKQIKKRIKSRDQISDSSVLCHLSIEI